MTANTENRVPFISHISELRTRLMWSVGFIVAGAVFGYFLRGQLLGFVQRPLGQTLYYTDPTGALSFVIKICVVFGVLFGLPVAMYHVFAFLGPLLSKRSKGLIVFFTFCSVVLAVLGAAFAYFVTLPAALHFLVGFSSQSIQALITADEYFNFAFAYILGVALLFQLPLLLLFINRIKPLQPTKLLGATRFVVLVSFIVAAIITPTPDPMNQGLMALPAILLYLGSILMIALVNLPQKRRRRRMGVKLPKAALPVVIPAERVQLRPEVQITTLQAAAHLMTKNTASRRVISDFV